MPDGDDPAGAVRTERGEGELIAPEGGAEELPLNAGFVER
jgi:hypothetical protein